MRSGWYHDSYRHSLAARGIRTSFVSHRGPKGSRQFIMSDIPIHKNDKKDIFHARDEIMEEAYGDRYRDYRDHLARTQAESRAKSESLRSATESRVELESLQEELIEEEMRRMEQRRDLHRRILRNEHGVMDYIEALARDSADVNRYIDALERDSNQYVDEDY